MSTMSLEDAEYIRDTCRDLLFVFKKYAAESENARNMLRNLEVMADEADAIAVEHMKAQKVMF